MKKKLPPIDFERALARGHVCYDSHVGAWWESQSADAAHRRAYRFNAEFVRDHFDRLQKRSPLIVDFACGGGYFLMELAKLMPGARLIGVDGSHKLLALTQARLRAMGVTCEQLSARQAFAPSGPRVRLVQTRLPNFSLPEGKADAVTFVFPNIAPAPKDQPEYDRHGYLNRVDVGVAKMLARFREMDPEDDVPADEPETLFHGLMTDRVLARNVRRLLRPKGFWFKVDYANSARVELGQISQWRSLFSEGALDSPVKTQQCERFFALRDNKYRRSSVILDVYHQTRDPSDQTGGYFITSFEAL